MSVLSRFFGSPALKGTPAIGNTFTTSFSQEGAGSAPALSSPTAALSGNPAIPADMISKFPELGAVTDPKVLEAYKTLPTLNYDNVPFGPGYVDDKKGRPSEYMWGTTMQQVLGKLGFWDWGRKAPKLPTTLEEIDKWKWMDTYLRAARQNADFNPKPGEWGFDYYKSIVPDMEYNQRLGYWTTPEDTWFSGGTA